MGLPNTHAHTYRASETHTHAHTKKIPKKRRCDDNQQTTVTHFGENNRLHFESSKQSYCIISLWVIIKAIFTSLATHFQVTHAGAVHQKSFFDLILYMFDNTNFELKLTKTNIGLDNAPFLSYPYVCTHHQSLASSRLKIPIFLYLNLSPFEFTILTPAFLSFCDFIIYVAHFICLLLCVLSFYFLLHLCVYVRLQIHCGSAHAGRPGASWPPSFIMHHSYAFL